MNDDTPNVFIGHFDEETQAELRASNIDWSNPTNAFVLVRDANGTWRWSDETDFEWLEAWGEKFTGWQGVEADS